VNLGSPRTAYAYASGQVDASILAWARAYKSWADRGGNRKAFLAPLQEMNGAWTAYGCDPVNYKLAYQHIQDLFMQVGVNRSMAWWVFAPNGWSSPCANNAKIKDYYPGDSRVDIIGFSSYNYGTCPSNSSWQTPEQVFGPYISEIRTTVSNLKPIFIAQTGVTSLGGDKDQWLRDAYKYLANQNVRGVIYFNMDVACNSSTTFNFTVYQPTGFLATGYKDAVNLPYTKYMSPPALATYPFQP
jgi:beta-mannanase